MSTTIIKKQKDKVVFDLDDSLAGEIRLLALF
jgi:hypothetical protein